MGVARHRVRSGARYLLIYEGPQSNLNRERNHHYRARHERDELTKAEAHALAINAKVPKAQAITLTVQPTRKGGNLPDVLAETECVKAFVDGLVLADVIPDDSNSHLRSVRMFPAQYGDRDAVIFTVTVVS